MIKLSEDNIGEYMYGLRLGKEDTKSTDHKEKMNKLDFIQIKNFAH